MPESTPSDEEPEIQKTSNPGPVLPEKLIPINTNPGPYRPEEEIAPPTPADPPLKVNPGPAPPPEPRPPKRTNVGRVTPAKPTPELEPKQRPLSEMEFRTNVGWVPVDPKPTPDPDEGE